MSSSNYQPAKILVVEDNPIAACVTLALLQSDPADRFQGTHAKSLAEAAEMLRQSTFSAVLLDLGLPVATIWRPYGERARSPATRRSWS